MSPRLLLRCSISLLTILAVDPCVAQSRTEDEFPPAKFITRFPYQQFSGGIMVVRATIDDFPDTLNFIMDTGSGGISLDSLTAERHHLKTILSDKTVKGIAGIKPVRYVYHQTLHLPGLTVDNMDFHTNDYEILSEVYGVQIDGIIGYSFLRQYILEVDNDSLMMKVYSPGRFRYPRGGWTLRPDFTTLPIIPLAIRDDHRCEDHFYFDTGAGLCFLMSKNFTADSAILDRKHKPVLTEAEGLGGKALMSLTVIKALHLGPYVFHQVPTYILDDEYNVTGYPGLGGLLGNDLLRRFNLVINYPFREIYIVPNGHYKDLFDYSYTGMSIYFIQGRVMITDVQKNSPASQAGIQSGDELFAVDNNFSHNIQVYKNLLQNAGNKIRLIVFRDGQPQLITLKIRKIS
ncbi:aspartyl protease family protein [Dinghuibacter silviterrae]|uniref:Aspartyl protease n=1 Tax=Dinghuibacter silviterrae TaxID=1539049 RepID=A0A4R8DPL8_9BACT|nr:aspartyl protease family protein [Dinghuibacter silviterrae]TDW99657.1 aspartyl protease [Dinghuibacter silviterrae]